eukprot:7946093-Alexandrium_andersonii.AAC.1
MSASLVGSEMCIRDSLKADAQLQSQECSFPEDDNSEAAKTARLIRARVPVSYTHLTLPTICSV